MKINTLIFLCMLFFVQSAFALKPEVHGPAVVYQKTGTFEEIKNDVIDAIIGRGIVISYVAHVQAMLDRTAKDVGVKENVYGNGETFMICKAKFSHELAQANPHQIVQCPWGISVYTLKNNPKTVYVSVRRPYDDEKAYLKVHKLLQDIIEEAIGD